MAAEPTGQLPPEPTRRPAPHRPSLRRPSLLPPPLPFPRPPLENVADLALMDPNYFSESELDQLVDSFDVFPQPQVRVRDLIDRLRRTYCGHIGVEFMGLLDSKRRRWLMPRMEHSENSVEPPVEEQRHILTK